jgi:hypothetical protein
LSRKDWVIVEYSNGGEERNRTAVHGFAGRCITTLPPRLRIPRLATKLGVRLSHKQETLATKEIDSIKTNFESGTCRAYLSDNFIACVTSLQIV